MEFLLLSFSGNVADVASEGVEARAGGVPEVQVSSSDYIIQRSRAKKVSQEEYWPEFTCTKSKKKSVMFANVISKDKGRTSPSAEKRDLYMDTRKGEEKANKEETIMIPTVKETVQYSTGRESREVETTSNMVADSLLTYMAVPQESRAVAERFSISELFAEQMKTDVVDNPSKPDTQDFQTTGDQANSANIQTKPLKDMQNIQNVTVKRLREIQFSPTTFKRRTLSASNVNIAEQIIFSRTVSKEAEEIPTLPDKPKLTEYMELPESYHIGLTAQEDAGISVEQAASPVDGQKATSLPQSTLPAESICTETNVKEECSREKVPGRRKLHYYYDVKEEIGRGSYSFVKRVVNKENGIQCAAKIVTLRRSIQAYEERGILSKLNHTRIACLLDVFETKRTLVLVLEMCSNEGLLDRLFKKNIVAEAEVRNYIQQILEGLHYLHDNNILHLDIKPANILMVHPEKDDIKICDFGFAQELTGDKLQFSKYGCPEFVAPEIVSQDPISTATDIWSIGVITFLCLTGSCPFSGENDRITLLNVKDGSFSWNSHDLECTTEDARSFVRRMIKLIPEDRPTASECLKDRWFQEKQKLQESSTINTKRLKFFLSRDKWQRSLMCYKSILVMRSIPQLLEESSESHSLGMPRHLFKQSNSSASSASSSDMEDYTQQTGTSDISQILSSQYFTDDGNHCETQGAVSFVSDILDPAVSENVKHNSVLTGSIAVEKQAIYDEDDVKVQCNPPEKCEDLSLCGNKTKLSLAEAATIETSDCSRIEVKATHKLTQAISTDSVLTPQALKIDSSPHSNSKPPFKLLPKHCLIKSSFYGGTLENRNLPSEDAPYTTSLERTRKHIIQAGYTKGEISELCQPLLDCLQMTPQEKVVNDKRFEETSSHISQRLYKSASCDIEDKVAYGPKKNLRKTKSLDEFETKTVVQTVKGSASELMHPCFQHSDPYSNTKAIGKPVMTLSTSVNEQVSDWQKTTLSDSVCSSEGITCFTDVLQYPTKSAYTEIGQSLHTDVPLENLEKEQNVDLEKEIRVTDNKEYNSEVNSSVVTSLQHSIDLQNKDHEPSQSFEDAESSSHCRLSEMESNSKKNQSDQKPINSHSSISEIRSFDIKGCTDSELQNDVSSFTASVVTCEPQTQSSSENVCTDAMKPDADYFDLSEPYSYELHDDPGPSVLTQVFKDKSTSQTKSLPEQRTSEEQIALRKTDANKGNAPRRKSDRRSTTSYELLCNEIEPVSEYLWDVTGTEWDSELLELLNGSDEDEIMSNIEEGTSKGTRKPKRTSLESKLYQSFESLRKAFKSEKEGRAPISSSEMSLIVGEGYDESGLKSTSKTSGRSGLFRLFSRSASVYWDKDFHDGDEERSRTSLSAFLERGKSQTLPARFSWQSLKSKDSAEKLELRRKKQQLSKIPRSASPSRMESAGRQYMEVMKAPLIPSLTTHNKEKQQVDMSTDISDNATGSLRIKSRLFSFKLPGSKSKEKAPLFLEELQNQSVVLSQCVTLTCRASGYPNPKICWFKDNQVMHRSDQILLSTTSTKCQLLTILNVAEEHLGRYKCVAENHLGKASTCCLLNLAVLPCCPDSPEVPQVFEDGALVIWKPLVSGMPITYIVQCQKKDEDWKTIASDLSESCFYASNVHKGEAYLYRVAYVNKAGKGPFSHPSVKVIIGETEVQSHSVHGEKPASMKQTYTFLAERNRGRFSIIKKCIENSTGKSFAAKITPYKKGRKPFVLKEYETLKKLHHSNIVETHCAYITPRYLIMIQELCEGKELLHYLAERSSYSEHHVVELLAQMLSAVEYLHFNHILHLDLKSENMIIVEHNILKLLDFGNAEIHVPGRPVLMKRCRDFVENMAPEILEGKPVVPETDIWAVGVVAFTMMSGDCPFKSDRDCDKEKNIRKGKIKLGRCYPDLSQGAVSFLKSTLCFNPGGRLCASECRSFPLFQEDTRMKLRNSGISFQTEKLRNYLKQREKQRTLLCTKHEVLLLH